MAFVVVSHLAHKDKSILADLLGRRTPIPVRQGRHGDVIEPDHVYVSPPGRQLLLRGGVLHVHRLPERVQTPTVIDRFFESLAYDLQSRARGVILSGMGNDGARGIEQIHGHGGATFAQEPGTAQFDQMPVSAIGTGGVDFVLAPALIARKLVELGPESPVAARPQRAATHAEIITELARATGVDFSRYKAGVLRRRIAKRIALKGLAGPGEYLRHLRAHPEEVQEVFGELLIHVSRFFRDAEAFGALERKAIIPLIQQSNASQPIRVWVPGCARGEEVYSIGMLLLEHCSRRRDGPHIQLFGTDISAADIEAARRGRFPEQIATHMPAYRLKRFFDQVAGGYQVRQELRELCVFTRQEVGSDPPFSGVDLISCRNLLIYFSRALQDHVLHTFHHALKPNGVLFLGRSESLGSHVDLFTAIDRKHRIYLRKSTKPDMPLRPLAQAGRTGALVDARRPGGAVRDPLRDIQQTLLQHYSPPGFYVDEDLAIRCFIGDVSAYLQPTSGPANLLLGRMLPAGAALDVRAAIRAARTARKPVRREIAWIGADGSPRDVTLAVLRVTGIGPGTRGYLVLFEPAIPPAGSSGAKRKVLPSERSELARMGRLLADARKQLQALFEEQERSAEELRAAHEEALSRNEELQGINEELQTAKEELQSANEELATLNEELQDRNQQLDQLAGELGTLIAGVNIPIVHLDRERRVRRFSPAAQPVFNLITTDVGRPFSQIKPSLALPELGQLVSAALDRGTVAEREVRDEAGRWFSLRLRPFRGRGNHIDGVLIALVDVDAAKRNTAAIVDTMNEPLLLLDQNLRVLTANPAYYRTFRSSPQETQDALLFELGNRLWDVPELHELIGKVLPRQKRFEDARLEHVFPAIGRKVLRLSGQKIVDDSVGAESILIMFQDVTDTEASAERLREAREQEEQRIAHELHDLSGGPMASLSIELARLADRVLAAPDEVAEGLRAAQALIKDVAASTHDLARRIHPAILEDLGLVKALRGECQALQDRYGIKVIFRARGRPDRLPNSIRLCVYRVVQEALRNIVRHARTLRVELSLEALPDEVRLVVQDNGEGFDIDAARAVGGMGLLGMADRVAALGGRFKVESRIGTGTAVRVTLPRGPSVKVESNVVARSARPRRHQQA